MSDHKHRLVVITPTGDRPWAFSLCVHYMNRQTRKPDEWVVVDDGTTDAAKESLELCRVKYTHIRLDPLKDTTVARNLREGLSKCSKDDYVVIMEDDDWYPADYLDTMYGMLQEGDYVYSSKHSYYNVTHFSYHTFDLPRGSNHNTGITGDALKLYKDAVNGEHSYGDVWFGSNYTGTRCVNDKSMPIHIVGHREPRSGAGMGHNIKSDSSGWTKDDRSMGTLMSWIGDDAFRYIVASYGMPSSVPFSRIFLLSNVSVSYSVVSPKEEDLLVFLNTGKSIDTFRTHQNKILYHRSPKQQYGNEYPYCPNRYVFDAGDASIPRQFIDSLKSRYDWNYEVEKGAVKSMTTGYMVTRWMEYLYPDSEIILVNFGYNVKNSTYRCPWHNWKFEDEDLKRFKHIYTESPKKEETPGVSRSTVIHVKSQKVLYRIDDNFAHNLCATAVVSSLIHSIIYRVNVQTSDRLMSMWDPFPFLDRSISEDTADVILDYKEVGDTGTAVDRAFYGVSFDLGDSIRMVFNKPRTYAFKKPDKEYQCPYACSTGDIYEKVSNVLSGLGSEVFLVNLDEVEDPMEVLYLVKGASFVVGSKGEVMDTASALSIPCETFDGILSITSDALNKLTDQQTAEDAVKQ